MNKLNIKMIWMILSIIILSIIGGLTFVMGWLWIFTFCILGIIWIGYQMYKLHIKTINQFCLFVESIKFSDSSISFNSPLNDKIYLDYYNNLNSSLKRLTSLTQKRESDLSFYNNLLNRIDFALIVTDETDNIIWINKIALDMLGRPKPQNINSFENIPKDLIETFKLGAVSKTKTIKIRTKGEIKNIVVNLSVILIKNKKIKIYSLKNVQPFVEEIEGLAWQQLISVLTHEMMNSLTPIISLSETLSNIEAEYDSETMNKAMSIIHRRSKGLVNFVNNYKKLTQIPTPQKENISVRLLIEDIVGLLKTEGLSIKQITISGDVTINADREQMEQVLINLIKNAWEACIDQMDPDIKISAINETGERVIISVSDNGGGISPEIQEKIFIPFYTTKPNGSGIGLSICRQIINLHGGTLTVSCLDNGSIFIIQL